MDEANSKHVRQVSVAEDVGVGLFRRYGNFRTAFFRGKKREGDNFGPLVITNAASSDCSFCFA